MDAFGTKKKIQQKKKHSPANKINGKAIALSSKANVQTTISIYWLGSCPIVLLQDLACFFRTRPATAERKKNKKKPKIWKHFFPK